MYKKSTNVHRKSKSKYASPPVCIDGMSIWVDSVCNYGRIQSLEQLLKDAMHSHTFRR